MDRERALGLVSLRAARGDINWRVREREREGYREGRVINSQTVFTFLGLTTRQHKDKENSYELNITICQEKGGQ